MPAFIISYVVIGMFVSLLLYLSRKQAGWGDRQAEKKLISSPEFWPILLALWPAFVVRRIMQCRQTGVHSSDDWEDKE